MTRNDVVNLQSSLWLRGQGTLDPLHLLAKLLESSRILGNVDPLRLLHLLDKVLHDPLVKVLPSQMCISMGSQDFKRTIINVQEGDIKRSATQIKYKHVLVIHILVHAICNRCSCRFVDDPLDRETSNPSSILGGLALIIIEVGRNSHDGTSNALSKVFFSSGFHFAKYHGRDFFGSIQ
mmetsp:Transcript_7182/g.16844  ORF Transcript_7182/g.16844 Transcript_7182/m.16844 type:complete len:179 (-) Transcript_7182:2538-3074(-)